MLEGRTKRLVEQLPEDFEAALVGTPVNRFYLLDFDAHDAGHLLILPDRMVYIIDSRYIEAARSQVTNAEVLLEKNALAQIGDLLKRAGVKHVMLEDGITLATLTRLNDKIPFVEYDVTSTLSKAFESLRMRKDAEELARMEKAQAITDTCFEHILNHIKVGVREIDLALEMESFMRRDGADGVAFETICVAGPSSSLPHGTPGEYRIQAGDFITMDFGAKYRGYCSDMTRTVALGQPGEEKRRVYDTVLCAHLAGIKAARAGLAGAEVDKVARDIITEAGYGGAFGHGLGHAVGIEVHESPRFSPLCHDIVPAGAVMTVEPGIYLAGRFGCRIEDMVLMTEDGCRPFPTSKKELIVL